MSPLPYLLKGWIEIVVYVAKPVPGSIRNYWLRAVHNTYGKDFHIQDQIKCWFVASLPAGSSAKTAARPASKRLSSWAMECFLNEVERTQMPVDMAMHKPRTWIANWSEDARRHSPLMSRLTRVVGPKPDSNWVVYGSPTGNDVPTWGIDIVRPAARIRLDNVEGMPARTRISHITTFVPKTKTTHCKWKACPGKPMNETSMMAFGIRTNVFSLVGKSELKCPMSKCRHYSAWNALVCSTQSKDFQ